MDVMNDGYDVDPMRIVYMMSRRISSLVHKTAPLHGCCEISEDTENTSMHASMNEHDSITKLCLQ